MKTEELEQLIKIEEENKFLRNKLKFHEFFDESSNYWKTFRDTEGKLSYVSLAFEHITGYSREDYINQTLNFFDIIHPDDLEFVTKNYQNQISNHSNSNFTCRIFNKKGQLKYLFVSSKAVYSQSNEYLGFRTTFNDITELRKVEESLKEHEEKYRIFFEKSPDPFFSLTREGKYNYVNLAFASGVGKTAKDIIGYTLWDVFPKEEADNRFKPLSEVFQTGNEKVIEVRVPRSDGDRYYITTIIPVNDENGMISSVICTSKDITQRKAMEEALRQSEEKYRLLAENITDVIWVLNIQQQKYTYISPSVFRLRGYTVEEAMNQSLEESLAPESAELVKKLIPEGIKNLLDNPDSPQQYYHELLQPCKDSRLIWIETMVQFQFTKNGEIEVYGVSRNIEQRKKQELALRQSEEDYKKIIENLTDIYYQTDAEGKLLLVSPSCLEIFGYNNLEEVLGQSIEILYTNANERSEFISNLKQHGKVKNYRTELYRKNGTKVFVETTANILIDKHGKFIGVEGIVRDITERKKGEEHLVQLNHQLSDLNATKDKLFSIIAHDLRSPFSSILGLSSFLLENPKNFSPEKQRKFIEQINISAKNSLTLLDNLLVWAKSQTGQMDFTPRLRIIHPIITEVTEIISPSAKLKNISISNHIPADIEIYADANMIHSILQNLLTNAIKFTHPGGAIEITAKSLTEFVEITVSDNGSGMDKETQAKLFKLNSNFTTYGTAKEKGSGLGLMICKEFVEKHGGQIWIESIPGKGSNFTFSLPSMPK